MGACLSKHDVNSKIIDSKLKETEANEQSYAKILFLGPGSSGKSTIFKQLQWLHGDGFEAYNETEVDTLIKLIHKQIVVQMQDTIKNYLVSDTDKIQLTNAISTVKHATDLQLTPELAESIKYIWQNDHRLTNIFTQNHTKKVLDESTECLWNDIDRIATINYTPTKSDIMCIRNRTTGIIEQKFSIAERNFHIFDVGGQKSERKKWISCFDEVRAVIFVVGVSSYNEFMFENDHKHYMVDAMELFDKTIHHQMFTDTPIILFLNKKDLLESKITRIPITDCPAFVDFDSDPNDYCRVSAYIQSKFEAINRNPKRLFYTHFTCAMDETNIKNIFDDVARILYVEMKNKLRSHGMI